MSSIVVDASTIACVDDVEVEERTTASLRSALSAPLIFFLMTTSLRRRGCTVDSIVSGG